MYNSNENKHCVHKFRRFLSRLKQTINLYTLIRYALGRTYFFPLCCGECVSVWSIKHIYFVVPLWPSIFMFGQLIGFYSLDFIIFFLLLYFFSSSSPWKCYIKSSHRSGPTNFTYLKGNLHENCTPKSSFYKVFNSKLHVIWNKHTWEQKINVNFQENSTRNRIVEK